MDITGKSTYTGTAQDMAVTAGLEEAAKGLGYTDFETTNWDEVKDFVNTEEVGGFSINFKKI